MQKISGRRMAIEGYTLQERRRGPNKINYNFLVFTTQELYIGVPIPLRIYL